MKLAPASHLLSCPVVFITTSHENKRDIMIGTAMFVSEKEPILTVSVAKGHLTEELIEKSGEFTVVAASEGQTDFYEDLLGLRFKDVDKFAALPIPTLPIYTSKALVPKDSSAWFYCKVFAKQEIDDFIVIIARVTDYGDLEKPPLLWQSEGLHSLKPA
jgi:flavin reductase (DIM6/NTAB) family NADH-FMN oxidoreductase RutF